jgi:hypothetical protein
MATKNTRDTKIEQGRDGKDENSERRKLGNDEPDRPRHFNREGREVTRRGGGKDETLKSGKSGNGDPNRPMRFGPRKTRNDAKILSLKLRT